MANFSGYYQNPTIKGQEKTVYGVAEEGKRVAFQDPTQLAEAQGLSAADFGQVKNDPTFNPGTSVNYSDYIKGLGQPTSNPTAQALAAAQASGAPPQTQGEANTALEAFAPKAPTFYKPTTPIEAYDPQTVFDTMGKPLSYDAFIAAGGKPDFSNVQSGMWPQTPATGVTPTTPKPTVSPFFEQQLALDPGYQQLLKSSQEFNSYINQQKSLTDSYKELTAELGIPAMNTELMNMKNVIEGTEEDLRNEITKVGGFATESQILALTNSRNKQLIKNYNNLLQTKQMAMETLNTMTNLMGQDRQFAMQAIDQRFQIDKQIADYQVKMQDNARNAYEKIVEQVGYAGLSQMTGGDPYYTSLVEKTLGLGSGGLAQLAAYKKPLTEAEQLELEAKKTGLETSKFNLEQAKTEAPLDLQLKQAQIANERRLAAGISLSGTGGGILGDITQMSPEAQAVINGTLRLEDLTPSVRGKIAGELNAAGFKSGPKLSSGQQDDLALMDTTAGQINQILDYNNDGKLEGVGFISGPIRQGLIKIFGKGSEEAKNVQALIGNIKGTIAKLRGGTSFTPNEEKLLASYTPNINENSASVINKLHLLNDFIVNKKTSLLKIAEPRGVPSKGQDLRSKYNY